MKGQVNNKSPICQSLSQTAVAQNHSLHFAGEILGKTFVSQEEQIIRKPLITAVSQHQLLRKTPQINRDTYIF